MRRSIDASALKLVMPAISKNVEDGTYRNGPGNGLTETGWLILLPFDKTNGVTPESKN